MRMAFWTLAALALLGVVFSVAGTLVWFGLYEPAVVGLCIINGILACAIVGLLLFMIIKVPR
ncbi:hypothetical protein LCGC14_2385930 [marine sediment metagenome]|uniref:Uncharacterized protein n=1 Tax=marine sediment metagenome TaxID=412755 RepID=A0A0F9EBY9_9ZZZZ